MAASRGNAAAGRRYREGFFLIIIVAQFARLFYQSTSEIGVPSEQEVISAQNDDVHGSFNAKQDTRRSTTADNYYTYDVSAECLEFNTIRPSGVFFVDENLGKTPLNTGPLVGSQIGVSIADKGKNTKRSQGLPMDAPHFQLMKEIFPELDQQSNNELVGFDIGANKGIYTYFLASLGFVVHSFEIDVNNFMLLQHGTLFNPKEVADRVNLYPVGLSDKVGRVGSHKGATSFRGYLSTNTNSDDGPILAASFDCFAYHTRPNLGKGNVFVKIDVEGFEIAVLKGARKSLLRTGEHVRALIIEVGPDRWSRAEISFEEGLLEMKALSALFQKSVILLRGDAPSSCPDTLAATLADKNPRTLKGSKIYHVEPTEWEPLLTEMKKLDADCNFWYSNR